MPTSSPAIHSNKEASFLYDTSISTSGESLLKKEEEGEPKQMGG